MRVQPSTSTNNINLKGKEIIIGDNIIIPIDIKTLATTRSIMTKGIYIKNPIIKALSQRPPAGSHLLHMAAGALAGPRLPDGRRVRARHGVPEHAPPQRKDTRRSGRAGDPAGTPPHANHPCQVQNAGNEPPASRCCRTASRRRGTASQSARPSPLRARAGCGCRG